MFYHDNIQDQLFVDGVALIANKNRAKYAGLLQYTRYRNRPGLHRM
jgi:hypothetical protein